MKPATNSLERALAILEIIEQTPGGLRHHQVSQILGIPKSTCSYIMTRLDRHGYLLRDNEGRYRIGLSAVALAHGALRELGIRSLAEPALYKLAADTGLSAGIGVLERGRVLIVDRVEGSAFVRDALEQAGDLPVRRTSQSIRYRARADRDIGRELPAHSTALGKVLLAYLPPSQALAVIARHPLARFTRKTIASKARLLRELELVRKRGFALAEEEHHAGLRSVAAPIMGTSGDVTAGVALNGSLAEPAWADADRLIHQLKAAAREISRRFSSRAAC